MNPNDGKQSSSLSPRVKQAATIGGPVPSQPNESSSEVRSRLLKMILKNEQHRKGQLPESLSQR